MSRVESGPPSLGQRVARMLRSPAARALTTVGAVALAAAVLGYMLYREREVLFNRAWSVNGWALAAAFGIYTLALFLAARVWVEMVHSLGEKVSFWRHFQYYTVSLLTRRLPGTVWYVAYLSQMYQKEGMSARVTSFASALEFAVSLISGMIVSLMFAVPILLRYRAGLVGSAVLLLIALGFLHPRVLAWFFRKLGIDRRPFQNRDLARWVFMYVGLRILSGGLVFAIAWIVYPLPFEHLTYVIGGYNLVGVLANALLFLPTNLGFTEVTFSVLMASVVPSSIAVMIAVLARVVTTLFEFVWAGLSLLARAAARNAE